LPLVVGTLMAIFWFRLPLLQMLGATCGGMTSTPGLAAITNKTDSSVPVVSYVAAYPVALALITFLAPFLARLLAQS
jgi:putative transport protein